MVSVQSHINHSLSYHRQSISHVNGGKITSQSYSDNLTRAGRCLISSVC